MGRLAAYPLLLLDPSFYVRQTFDAACRLAGVKPNIFIESRTPHALLALAEAGHGVAIVPSVLPIHRYRLRIARLTHGRKPLRERFAVLWDNRRVLPPYAEDFRQSLAAYMRESFPIARPPAPKARSSRAPQPPVGRFGDGDERAPPTERRQTRCSGALRLTTIPC
ncbi:MAG: LysR family transcriptional regulator substrate-binding protein [Xanthobacteraceae bacterium]